MWKLGALDIPSEKAWGISTPQHPTHTRHHNDWGEISTHHKWESKEGFFWYTQHRRTNFNTTANIHWESDTKFWQLSSHQSSHCMVQSPETTWRCTAHTKIHSSKPLTHHTRSGQNRSTKNMGALCHLRQILATLNIRPWNLLNIKSTYPPPPSFLVFPTPSILYALLGGLTDGVALALAGGVGDNVGVWRRQGEGG